MARSRNIKPGFFQNEELGELDPLARLLFIGMWTISDYKGCIEYRPKRLKVQLLPYDNCDIEELTINLDESGFISMYSVQGQRYIKILNFELHQNPHKNEREAGSDIPDIDKKDNEINDKKDIQINRDKNGTARADSLNLIPDSLNADSLIDAVAEKPAPAKKGQSLHADWKLPQAWGQWAYEERPEFSIDQIRKEAEKFKDYWIAKPGAAGRKLDWQATWRNWFRNAKFEMAGKQSVHDKRTKTAIAMFGENGNGNNNSRIIDVSPDHESESDRALIPANG